MVRIAGDLDVYVVGAGPRCLVVAYDAFGFQPAHTRSNCDALAAAGFLVVMPDLFRGTARGVTEGWAPPPAETTDADILDRVLPFAVAVHAAKVFGILGFCFGGMTALRLAASGRFAGCGGIHAAGMGDGNAEAVLEKATCPVLLLQAGNDPPLNGAAAALRDPGRLDPKSEVARLSVLRTFWDMDHGWCGATGDRARDLRVRAAVESAIAASVSFFTRTVRFMNAD